MDREAELRYQCNFQKPSPPRPPADGQEQIPISCEAYDLSYKFQQSCGMSYSDMSPSPTSGCTDNRNIENDCGDSPVPSEPTTPPYFKWAQNLLNLLKDFEGIQLFQQYLEHEVHDTRSLDFWFACEGFRRKSETNSENLCSLIKAINHQYVRGLPEVSPRTKREIANKIASKVGLHKYIFDEAQKEVEVVMSKTTYPNFLRSDFYVQHIQRMDEHLAIQVPESEPEHAWMQQPALDPQVCSPPKEPSAKRSSSSSPGGSRERLDVLPTVFEDSELQCAVWNKLGRRSLNQKNKLSAMTGRIKPEDQAGHYLKATTPGYNTSYMKYSAYLPPSAQDSEFQSASSDALTDDTLSMTDSVESVPLFRKACQKKLNKHQKSMRCNGPINSDHLPRVAFIPRTERLPQVALAEMPPEKFAALLTAKLNKLQDEIKMKKAIDRLSVDSSQPADNQPCTKSETASTKTNGTPLFSFPGKSQRATDTPQSILDEHICRVFHDSAHQTPSPSPGCLTPAAAAATQQEDMSGGRRVPPCGSSNSNVSNSEANHTGILPYMYQPNHCKVGLNSPYYLHQESSRHHRDRDSYSVDSGVQDFASDFDHQGVPPSQQNSMAKSFQSPEHNTGMSRRSYGKKLLSSDSGSSCMDSGISLIDLVTCSTTREEKVTTWLEMKKYSEMHGPDSDKDSQICHRKYSPSMSPDMGQSSKKLMYNNISHGTSGSLENAPWLLNPSGACGSAVDNSGYSRGMYNVHPSQPIAQDPNMPLLPIPDTESQILEVKRRLEDDSRFRQQMKPKLMMSGREKMANEGARSKTIARSMEFQEDGTLHRKLSRRSYPSSSQSVSKPVNTCSNNNDVTVVAYRYGTASVPYLSKLPGKNINFKQFKTLITKKGKFRYFFKANSDMGVVFEEVFDDLQVLPLWEGKICSVVEQIE